MPEVVRALAAPLSNVDKITIVSTGNGATSGMHKITGDITEMAAQIPALFETLSGMPFNEMFAKERMIADKAPKPDDKAKRNSGTQRGRKDHKKALLERGETLGEANLNDLADKREDPEKMMKHEILDMQNQVQRCKNQVSRPI